MEDYFSTDEQLDVLISLKETLHQLQRTQTDLFCWKWATVAIVSATNGALVCNLNGTMQVGALKKADRYKMLDTLEGLKRTQGLGDLPEVYLESPVRLLKMASNEPRFDPGAGPRIKITATQQTSFEYLVELRNLFLHFKPQGLSIETTGLPKVFWEVISIVEEVSKDGHSFRHLSAHDKSELQNLILELKALLK